MNKTSPDSFLGGKVLRTSLPIIHGRPSPDAPRLKRLMLDQGELTHFCDGEPPVRYVASVELLRGTRRGNHYHKVKRECFYLVSGEVLLSVRDSGGSDTETLRLRAGELAEIDVGVAHVFKVVEPGQAIEFSEARFDSADVYPFPLE